jgi:acyl-CoA thioesterase-2
MSEPRAPRESLAEMLRIERRGGACVAQLESFWGAAAPGDLVARAVLASGRVPAAVHAVFLREAKPEVELTFECEALAPERTRVGCRAGGERLAEVWLRSGGPREGLDVQIAAPERDLPAPDALPSEAALAAEEGWAPYAVGPIESRRVTPGAPVKDHEPAVWIGWLRPRAPLPADPVVQAAALAFLAEYRSHWAVERRLGADFPRTVITLLDFALFVHRAVPWDDWRLVRTTCDVAAAGRCLSHREIFTRGGALVASAVWEAALAPR